MSEVFKSFFATNGNVSIRFYAVSFDRSASSDKISFVLDFNEVVESLTGDILDFYDDDDGDGDGDGEDGGNDWLIHTAPLTDIPRTAISQLSNFILKSRISNALRQFDHLLSRLDVEPVDSLMWELDWFVDDALNAADELGIRQITLLFHVQILWPEIKRGKYSEAEDKYGTSECMICLEELREDDEVAVVQSCSHIFHYGCLNEWLDGTTCPYSCNRKL